MKKNNKRLRLILFVLMLCLCAMGADASGHSVPDLVENVLAESLVVLVLAGPLSSVTGKLNSPKIDLKKV